MLELAVERGGRCDGMGVSVAPRKAVGSVGDEEGVEGDFIVGIIDS